jgi:hypothetical protein
MVFFFAVFVLGNTLKRGLYQKPGPPSSPVVLHRVDYFGNALNVLGQYLTTLKTPPPGPQKKRKITGSLGPANTLKARV